MSATNELALPLTLMPRTHQSRIGIQDVAGVRVAVVEFCNADFDAIHDTGEPAIALARANAIVLACNTHPALVSALEGLLDHYVQLVNSGDAGNWDPEKEPVVIAARHALRLARGEE